MCFANIDTFQYGGSSYNFSTIQWCENDLHSVESVPQVLNFNLLQGQLSVVQYSLVMLDSSFEPQLPVKHVIMRVNKDTLGILNPYDHSVFHIQYSIH